MGTSRKRSLRDDLAFRHLYEDEVGKAQEQSIIEGFLARLHIRPYTLQSAERPDFVISFGNGSVVVGCEVTLFDSDSSATKKGVGSEERRFYNQWKRFAKKLRQRLDREGGQLLYLFGTIDFKTPSLDVLDDVSWNQLIEEITQVAKSNQETGIMPPTFDAHSHPLLAKIVDHIFLHNYYPDTGLLWWCSHLQSGTVGDPNNALIRSVQEKSAKAKQYDWGLAQEKWLIIYAHASGLSDVAVLGEDPSVSRKVDNIPFTHIFLWDRFSENIHELYPEFRIIFGNARDIYVNRLPRAVQSFLIRPDEKRTE